MTLYQFLGHELVLNYYFDSFEYFQKGSREDKQESDLENILESNNP